MSHYPILTSERLVLRFFEKRDIPFIVKLLEDIEISQAVINLTYPYTAEMAEKWIARHKEQYDEWGVINLAITLLEGGAVIGAIGLFIQEEHLRAELGYWIGKSYWGNGYATEAGKRMVKFGLQEIGLNKIVADCFAHNKVSCRVLEKIGFSQEGYHPKHVQKTERFYDMISFGILHS